MSDLDELKLVLRGVRVMPNPMTILISTFLETGLFAASQVSETARTEEITTILNRIDQAIVNGFAGRDIETVRLDRALSIATERMREVNDEQNRIEPFLGTGVRGEGAEIRQQWDRLARQEAVLQEAINSMHQARLERMSALEASSPIRSVGTNACCCVHEQVMGAVNKGMAEIPEGSTVKQLMNLSEAGEKGKAALENLISPEAKANLDAFSAKFSDIFVRASRDGKITAGEIGASFKQMAAQILKDQVFSKLFSQAGPIGQIAGNLLGGLLGFAGGGAVNPNVPVLVGERGPELLVPRSPGRIMNYHNTRSSSQSRPVVINQTVKIEPTTKNDLFAMIQAARPALRDDAKRAVFEALNHIRY